MVANNAIEHTIGGRIKSMRNERDVTQLELAAALKISTSALRNIEQGTAMPRLSTLEMMSDFFKVSIDYIVRGVTPDIDDDSLVMFRETGLNDLSKIFLGQQIDLGKYCGGLNEYITTLNALISGGFLTLVWTLNRVNRELSEIDTEIKKILDESPKPDNIVEQMQLSTKLEPLREKRDLLKLRYLREVERIFDNLIINEED